jgi:sulfonate transport system ATP-binding protein
MQTDPNEFAQLQLVDQPNRIGARVTVRALDKGFDGKPVLQSLDLDIEPGEFLAIVGRSGCGKSTLLRLVASLDSADSGEIGISGLGSTRHPEIRIMFQDARLLPWKRVLDNVAIGLRPGARKTALEVLSSVGLAERGGDWPAILSGGQRQRVALARALVHQPDLLLLDEPLGALDALTRIEMQQLIEGLWRRQRFTALLVTHDVAEAIALADRVVLIEDGRITLDLKVDLLRPRQRGSARFAELEDTVLRKVLKHAPDPADFETPCKPESVPAARLRWAI